MRQNMRFLINPGQYSWPVPYTCTYKTASWSEHLPWHNIQKQKESESTNPGVIIYYIFWEIWIVVSAHILLGLHLNWIRLLTCLLSVEQTDALLHVAE